MEKKILRLHPFGAGPTAGLDIVCTIGRQSGQLLLAFSLQGDLSAVEIAPEAKHATRRQRLWECTCLESFLAVGVSPAYWEFNMSPAGHWNVYRFDDYRQGMREERAVATLIPEVRKQSDAFCLGCTIDLKPLGLDRLTVRMGVAAVIRSRDGQNSYWAPVHPAPQPDFHHRDSFVLSLAP